MRIVVDSGSEVVPTDILGQRITGNPIGDRVSCDGKDNDTVQVLDANRCLSRKVGPTFWSRRISGRPTRSEPLAPVRALNSNSDTARDQPGPTGIVQISLIMLRSQVRFLLAPPVPSVTPTTVVREAASDPAGHQPVPFRRPWLPTARPVKSPVRAQFCLCSLAQLQRRPGQVRLSPGSRPKLSSTPKVAASSPKATTSRGPVPVRPAAAGRLLYSDSGHDQPPK